MAEGLFRARLGEDAGRWRVESAGTWARNGDPAASRAQLVLQERGIDLSAHRSRIVTAELLAGFELILVMEQGHKEALQIEFPAVARRVFLFSEMVGLEYDVDDPMGGSTAEFRHTAADLSRVMERGFEKIARLAGNETHPA